eukprot:TRINITY_DN3306_c0_g1_i2.p2 TRINITY_DN3306_c0_g1~~TRINITY_DN3306_c0_g1_i2.p2  ORF type:complete len:59 (+),score=0.41 TRINITY_DN3306_c0_g1_i2:268-444(+)
MHRRNCISFMTYTPLLFPLAFPKGLFLPTKLVFAGSCMSFFVIFCVLFVLSFFFVGPI